MSIFIEQDKEQARAAFQLQSHADLDSIRLVEVTARCKFAMEDVSFPLRFLLKHKAEDAVVANAKLTVYLKCAFKAVTTENEAEVIVVACRLEAVYDLADGFDPTPEQIEAFKDGNAIFNCWTYFREFVHNTIGRMNYPPVTLPFLRMVPKAAQGDAGPKKIEGADSSKIEPYAQQATPHTLKRRKKKEA